MKSAELRDKFIKFFEEKGHKHLSSSSLIPEDDPSVLLTTAGMQQFKKWFAGFEEPAYFRVVTIQKCVRVGDIDEVGDDTHLSFFEMLGNFAFNSAYWKKEAIEWGIEFIRDELDIDFQRMSFTYFKGNREISRDKESLKVLKELGIPRRKIKAMGKEDNFWGPTGNEGPCGPTVEIYVDNIEIWNLVFNEYYRTNEGKYNPLKSKSVDTGAGLERVLSVINGEKSVYSSDEFAKIIDSFSPRMGEVKEGKGVKEYSGRDYTKAERIIADHIRAATFLLADGVEPSNLDRGYIVRRLIRRAIRNVKKLGIESKLTKNVTETVVNNMKSSYGELEKKKQFIYDELEKEGIKFQKPLDWVDQYKKDLDEAINYNVIKKIKNFPILSSKRKASGYYVYENFQTYGVPPDLSLDIIDEMGLRFDEKEYENAFKEHQEKSKKGAEKKFKGGLASGGEMEKKYHTATHLLHQALKMVLGDHVKQSGSNITSDRLRFDFTHSEKMTSEERAEVEKNVNAEIDKGLEIKCEEMSLDKAKKSGAIGIFDSKYGDKVKVYSIGNFSKEICGGPHVENTSKLGKFRIKKEESSSAGVRRIKAVLE